MAPASDDAAQSAMPALSVRGTSIYEGDHPFRFLGVNEWSTAVSSTKALPNSQHAASRPTSLEHAPAELARLHDMGVSVIRFWLFQSMLAKSDGTLDFGPLDTVLNVAESNHQRVAFALTNGQSGEEPTWPASASSPGPKRLAWFQGEYRAPQPPYALSYLDYARAVAAHVRGNPQVAWIDLINEPHPISDDASCDESSGARALRTFADEAALAVKSQDPARLVSLGTEATVGSCGQKDGPYSYCAKSGAAGCHDSDFEYVHAGAVDLISIHDYSYNYCSSNGCNVQSNDFYTGLTAENDVRLAEAYRLGKPVFFGEIGMGAPGQTVIPEYYPPACSSRDACMDRKLGVVLGGGFGTRRPTWGGPAEGEAPVSGVMLWEGTYGKSGVTGSAFSIGPWDPLDAVISQHAASLGNH